MKKSELRGRISEGIYKQLARDIIHGQYVAGMRLDESMLAERFEVSRTPIREALKQLVISGLVVYRPNRGITVAHMSSEKLDQMFETIGVVEAECAYYAALRMTAEEKKKILSLHQDAKVALQQRDKESYDRHNIELHYTIIQGAHNPVLAEIVENLRNRVALFRSTQFDSLERMHASFFEHEVIIDAILKNDAITAQREAKRHLMSARRAIPETKS